ncbi:MAG: hypothetical protein IPK35_05200 [Saprospiraceae bacterium]|jgi:hypothetical protein|nr:hypothetical protein [Saprospiraceae bacterium]
MTKVQENLMVKWLENDIDDEDAQLLIKDFDASNLEFNLKMVDGFTLKNGFIEDKWNDFQKLTLVKTTTE